MNEKVKLRREVCDALDKAKTEFPEYAISEIFSCLQSGWLVGKYMEINNKTLNTLMRALVIGYEPELSAEELTMQLWSKSNGYVKDGIRDALRIHGIRYDWMDDAE